MTAYVNPARILVTGAAGNLGRKVVEALASTPWCTTIIGVDRAGDAASFPAHARERLQFITADLSQTDSAWTRLMAGTDAVVHLAAIQPTPDATWQQAVASYDMTLRVLRAAAEQGVRRFVFASSNHVMGGYKDQPLAGQLGPGKLTTALPVAPGTHWHNGIEVVDSTAYATSKAMGERLCAAVAALSGGRLTSVALRIGWAQPGDNDPNDINYAGAAETPPPGATLDEQSRIALRWFRNMWLSNGDLARLFIAAVSADGADWPDGSVIVNGVSDNGGMDWDLGSARRYLGYAPQDDLYRLIAE
ncbi:NAD(P)-dependent oxidoreductase [Cupriavidus necator]|uniref:NAD-dependent epimerase/dehydratase family protein n=1 Tax=Cupriavidus necator TaxID=106590 RepID=UPI00339D50BF